MLVMPKTQLVLRSAILIAALGCLVAPASGGVLAENFDFLVVPALPVGWTATNASGSAPLWVTQSGANCFGGSGGCLFIDDPASISDKQITTPTMVAGGSIITFSFQNRYQLESTFDGGVFEVSINAGAYVDVSTMPGFAATSGWYTGPISSAFGNPLAGRQAWSGNPAAYILTSGSFSSNPADSLQFRFRMGSDNSIAATGWRIDNVNISGGEAVPESSTLALVCAGLAGLFLFTRRARA